MKQLILLLLTIIIFGSCTKNFEATNQDPNQISDELQTQDNNLVGGPISGMLYNLNGGQVEEDLCQDNWMGYMATGTDFVGNSNNTTYYITWNNYWGREYGSVMSPAKQVIELAAKYNLPIFATWAKFIKILGMSKLTAVYGPIIYSNYGSSDSKILYDKESDLYDLFFKQLDTIQATFAANMDYQGFKKFDAIYNGSIPQWMKLVNSIRLRLAIRLSKVAPDVAKTQGEKAMKDPAGLITTNKDNFLNSLLGNILPLAQICFQWDDTRMGAVMESFMGGLKDPRVASYYAPVSDPKLYADHPDFPYKGIRNGAYINTKADHIAFSKANANFNDPPNGGNTTTRRDFTAAEVAFLKAEAGLRGWAGAGDPKENYENGVRLSFADWGAGGVDGYLADKTSKPLNYVDPVDSRNNFTSLSTITVAWNDADSKELKLEKIITQKWINNFTNSLESWVDFRRTGYPKIPHVAKNTSSADWGVIPATEWIKRMPYPNAERIGNPDGVADAVTKMGPGAKDDIATRLWFDTGNPANF
ncbi:SusD/RagB family nutrient-binding outer membrane lipoprotein [Arachidicoccus terrestris]|uniref:SusD/RagB family nutrient-binding outer membrane lipoprotein n=1 Tax=Arachidicoccus terrestris TaxID=2875539 RepID=UPI001CC57863|nr:SusD/RagB family nutrient-binding outer membrane lipoprotein [Arachidicoccus terrestris]UAY55437.1 SusD/RagB family nutrient-binding outer membrane lipoprotein [Arachidicoccus terrestris]